jgi:hypothetical protein
VLWSSAAAAGGSRDQPWCQASGPEYWLNESALFNDHRMFAAGHHTCSPPRRSAVNRGGTGIASFAKMERSIATSSSGTCAKSRISEDSIGQAKSASLLASSWQIPAFKRMPPSEFAGVATICSSMRSVKEWVNVVVVGGVDLTQYGEALLDQRYQRGVERSRISCGG